jgi:hypothetical protein
VREAEARAGLNGDEGGCIGVPVDAYITSL